MNHKLGPRAGKHSFSYPMKRRRTPEEVEAKKKYREALRGRICPICRARRTHYSNCTMRFQ